MTSRPVPVEIDIDHVARLARLELSDEEKGRLRTQLAVILDNAAKVGEVATEDVPPTAYAIPRSNVLRPDELTASLPVAEVLANAPDVEDDRFKVPPIVEGE
jgi:aspartyl-tRNA(Asn)/glutamyl-tRNA(Gln) amidotransferase subunit C